MAKTKPTVGFIQEILVLPRGSVVAVSLGWMAGVSAFMWGVSHYSFPLFHGLAETFSVGVTGAVFAVAWNARRSLQSGYLVLLGIASLFVGFIDLLHTFAYQGTALFPGFGNDLPTQLWIASRALQAASLLIASFFFLRRKVRPEVALAAYAAVTALLLLSILVWRVFPVCYVDGKGLTPFKIVAEYVISGVLLLSLWPLARPTPSLAPNVKRLLALFILFTILAEVAFTSYVIVFGPGNILGHILKIIAYAWLYRALVVTGLKRPLDLLVRDLKESERSFRRERDLAENLIEAAPVMIVLLDAHGRVRRHNPAMGRLLGVAPGAGVGADWFARFVPEEARVEQKARFERVAKGGRDEGGPTRLLSLRGAVVPVHLSLRSIPGSADTEGTVLMVGQALGAAAPSARVKGPSPALA